MIKGPYVPKRVREYTQCKDHFPSAAELKENMNQVTSITEIVMDVSFVPMKTLY